MPDLIHPVVETRSWVNSKIKKKAGHTVSAAIKIVCSSSFSWLLIVCSSDKTASAWYAIHSQSMEEN